MIIFFRFLMFFVGALYKIYGKFLKQSPHFIKDETENLEFAFVIKRKKNSTRTHIIFKDSTKIFFRISTEKKLHRFLKNIGFNSELQTGNFDFDINHYIESDHPSFRRALKNNHELQNIIMELRKLGFDSITSLGDGSVSLESTLYSAEAASPELLKLTKNFKNHLENIKILRGESDPFIFKILVFEVFYYSIGFYGVSTYIAHSLDDGLYQIDPWNLTIKGIYLGAMVLLAWIAIAFTALKNSSRAPVFFGEVFFGMLICLVLGGSQMMVDLNEFLDLSEPVYTKALLVEKYSRTTRTRRSSRTSFYLRLQFDQNEFDIDSTLRVNVLNYHNLHEGAGVEFEIRKGYFDSPYIVSMKSVPIEKEKKEIKKYPVDYSKLKDLANWLSESSFVTTENIEWHEEYYPDKKQLRQKEPFVAGKRQGIAEYWHPNGKLYGQIPWDKDQKHGRFILYRADGSMEQSLSYKDGKPHGLLTWYNPDGTIHGRAIYQDGEVLETDIKKIESLGLTD